MLTVVLWLCSILTHLETLKHEAAEVAKKVEETDVVMAEVETTSQQYVPLAQSCSSIYFTLEALKQVTYRDVGFFLFFCSSLAGWTFVCAAAFLSFMKTCMCIEVHKCQQTFPFQQSGVALEKKKHAWSTQLWLLFVVSLCRFISCISTRCSSSWRFSTLPSTHRSWDPQRSTPLASLSSPPVSSVLVYSHQTGLLHPLI